MISIREMNHSKKTLTTAAIAIVVALTGVALAIPQAALAHIPQHLFATGSHGINVDGANGANGVNGGNGVSAPGANGISAPGVNGTSSNGVNGGNANGVNGTSTSTTVPKSGFFN
jgi:hypothetical protein